MEDRIRKFIEYKGISPSELADTIGVQRSNVTHVLKARNKPSFQFIEKLLQTYPELNAKWLLLGTGNMVDTPNKTARILFDTTPKHVSVPVATTPVTEHKEEKAETIAPDPAPQKEIQVEHEEEKTQSERSVKDQFFSSEKPIERLIVFFKDQTFKVYHPSR